MLRRTFFVLLIITGLILGALPVIAGDQAKLVFVPIKGNIEPGLADFVERSLDRAYRMGAQKVVLEIDTPGGLIKSAHEIRAAVFDSKVPTVAFVNSQAKSAGVLVSLAAEKIYMTPGASIGAAEPVPVNEKILASWRSDLESAAEARGRDPRIVAGMADKSIEIPGVKKAGEILSLSAKRAVELGFADGEVQNRNALLTELARKDGVYYQASDIEPGWGEKLAWWIVNPFISPILLLIGFAGLLAEAFIPGWGLGGTIGLIALALYFGGHMMAGVAGWMAVLVFGLGVIAILLEIFVIPGFTAAGLIGLVLIIWSIFLASTSPVQAVVSLSVAGVGSIVLLYFLIKVLGRRGIWDRLILGIKMDKNTGYIASKKDLDRYLGLTGVALTTLRPAGTAVIDGDRVDVVTEGGFIKAGEGVKVVLVEGGRVVVRHQPKTGE